MGHHGPHCMPMMDNVHMHMKRGRGSGPAPAHTRGASEAHEKRPKKEGRRSEQTTGEEREEQIDEASLGWNLRRPWPAC